MGARHLAALSVLDTACLLPRRVSTQEMKSMHATFRFGLLATASLLALSSTALAHVSVSGAAYANQNALLTFGVGHGCEGFDTVAIEVSIPKEVGTGLRVMPHGVFGTVEVKKDSADIVTSVLWTKDTVRETDDGYYQLQLRAKMPDAPFSTVLFPTKQTCRAPDGTEYVTDWKATPEEAAAAKDGEDIPPAPALVVLPVRAPGWNKFTAASAISDLTIFKDAEIVWVGDAAYSSNPTTTEQIASEDDVEPLTTIAAGAEIWVKY
jgi:periplasmic copper chaperone A